METIPTIVALATPAQPSALAVIRVSGPRTRLALKSLFKSHKDPTTNPRLVVYGQIIDFESKNEIDNALCFFMPGPHSFTGEDVGEFQFHGSPILVQKVLRSLYSFGLNPAEPGEFTKRAFLNKKLDLAQAEAIADLIGASSEEALRIAGEQLSGKLSSALEKIGEPLRNALAELEAGIDFVEEDISPASLNHIKSSVDHALHDIESLLGSYEYGSVLREGFRVLLCGPPNVGKSSILNVLLNRERAIVTNISGTTRDLIEEEALLKGFRFVFCDSAGIRETEDPVESIGIDRTRSRLEWADLVLLIADATDESRAWEQVRDEIKGQAKKIWMIVNKIDLNPQAFGTIYCDLQTCEQNVYLSAKTRQGIEGLIDALCQEVTNRLAVSPERSIVVVNERHRLCLSNARDSLRQFEESYINKAPAEVLAVDIRSALHALDEIVGRTYTEDILGRIFSRFCIGK